MDEQRLTDIKPSQRNIFAIRLDVLGPKVTRISSLAELRIRTGDCGVGELCVEHSLHGRLQPARHRDIVRIDTPAILGEFALQIENVAGPGWREYDSPKTRVC
jgi:hypothetical protein